MALRVWYAVNNLPVLNYRTVTTPEAGAQLINRIAARQLRDPGIWMNVFGLETDEDGEWGEWYDEEDEDVLVLADRLRESNHADD